MANPVPAAILISAEKPRTAPIYLVRIGFDPPLLISTAGDVVHDGELYKTDQGLIVGTTSVGGAQITLDNSSGGLTSIFNSGVQNTPVSVFIHYGGSSTARASLFISDWRSDNDNQIVVSLVAEPSRVTRVPAARFVADSASDKLNYMPRSGDVLQLGMTTIRFE